MNRRTKGPANLAALKDTLESYLVERLYPFSLTPQRIHLTADGGETTRKLIQHYPKAYIVTLGLTCHADFKQLPFNDNTFDLAIANLPLEWSSNLTVAFQESYRILKQDGLFLFSWLKQNESLEEIGDLLLQTGFQDVVIDKDFFQAAEVLFGCGWKTEPGVPFRNNSMDSYAPIKIFRR